jgi:HAD superfamily hydrolase (TIGR01509 family)
MADTWPTVGDATRRRTRFRGSARGHQTGMDSTEARAGVLLDVDGTLLDTNYLHVLAWWRAFRDTGHEDVTMVRLHRAIGMASELLTEEILGQEDKDTVEAHSKRFEELRSLTVALPGAADLVKACADRGLATVLATSGKSDDLDWMVPAIGADDALSGTTTSEDVDRSKPAPDLLQTAVDQNGLDAARTTVVGDTVWDVLSARRAGMVCVGLTSGGISEQELREAGAVEVYDDPADLVEHLAGSVVVRRAEGRA